MCLESEYAVPEGEGPAINLILIRARVGKQYSPCEDGDLGSHRRDHAVFRTVSLLNYGNLDRFVSVSALVPPGLNPYLPNRMSDSVTHTDSGEKALRRSRVLERVTEGIVALDTDLRYTYVNDRAEQILDTDREQLIGQRMWDAFPEAKGTVTQEAIEAARATQDQQSFERYNSALDKWFDVRIYPDDSGLSLYFTDITDRKKSEEELRRANRRLTALIENTDKAVYVKGREGRYQLMNEAAASLFGIEPKEAVGKRDEELFDAESAAHVREVDERIIRRKEPDSREGVRHIDGEEHVFLDNKYPYYDEDGDVVGIMGISRDITDRKRRQRDLQKSRQRLKTLFDDLPVGVVIHDADGHVIDVNDQTLDKLGYTREELLSMNVAEFEVGLSDEELQETWAAMEVGRRAKKSGRHRRKDGSTFPIEVWVDKTKIGDEERFIALSRDVTARRRNEQTLKALTGEYRALLRNVDDAIFFLDVDEKTSGVEFRFKRLNSYYEAATGLTTEDVQGKTPREAYGADLGAELEANYRRCVEAGEPISYREELSLPAGTKTWQTKLAPVIVDGEVTRIVGIARDVTAQVRREETLRRKNERLDEFAGIVAHDLRNPLNAAQLNLTLAKRLLEEAHRESIHLEKAQGALARMENIIFDLLVLARRREDVESSESVSVAEVAGQCWDMVESGEASLVVDTECTIKGDPDRLQHVCENLFRNAVEHGGDDVTIRIGRAGNDILYVEDSGPGIPPGRRKSVFEPGRTSQDEGTGYGLAIVERIAEAHGWTVHLTEAEGGGTRFEFGGVEILS